MSRRRSWLRRWLKKLRSAQISRFTLQRRIMLVLGIYLAAVLVIGGWYAAQRLMQPSGYRAGGTEASGALDLLFLEEIMRELASISASAGGGGGDTAAGQGAGTFPGQIPGQPGLWPQDYSSFSLSPGGGAPGTGQGTPPAQAGPGGSTAGSSQGTAVSEEKLNELQKKVSVTDRLRVLNILRKRLSAEDIKQLAAWAQGGVTAAEKEALKQLLVARLTPEELAEFKALYQKYY